MKKEEKGVTRGRKGGKEWERREQSGKDGKWGDEVFPPPTIIKEKR